MSIRELSHHIGCSYEQVRKIVNGEPVVGAELNEKICSLLGLGTDEMWKKAQAEKSVRRFGTTVQEHVPPALAALWQRATPSERTEIRIMFEGMILRRERLEDPEPWSAVDHGSAKSRRTR
jgi:plasmid maintenance system antidote protein VapI